MHHGGGLEIHHSKALHPHFSSHGNNNKTGRKYESHLTTQCADIVDKSDDDDSGDGGVDAQTMIAVMVMLMLR